MKPQKTDDTVATRAVVRFDEAGVSCTRPFKPPLTEHVRWSDLGAVIIHTAAVQPTRCWTLLSCGGLGGCIIPLDADGCDRLLERFQELPGFSIEAVEFASQCVDQPTVLCWEREGGAFG
jgi:hypothetical protein